MFYALNKYQNLQLVLALLLFAWSAYTVFVQMTPFPPEGQPVLYQAIYSLWGHAPVLCKSIVLFLLLFSVLLLQHIFLTNKFSDNRTFLPVVFFLLFLNTGHFLQHLTPAFFTMLVTLLVLLINTNQENGRPVKNKVFFSGVLISVAALVDLGALWLILFMVFALLTDKNYRPKDILVLLSGILMVIIYLVSYYYLTDSWPSVQNSLRQLTFFAFFTHISDLAVLDWVLIGFLLLSGFYVIAVLKIHYDTKLIVLRKHYMLVVFLCFLMSLSILLTATTMPHTLIYWVVPFSLLDGMLAQLKMRRYLNDILIIAVFVLLWF